MDRRAFLTGAGVAGAGLLAGCGVLETRSQGVRSPPLVEDRPGAVYYPSHVEGMQMVGTAAAGDFQFAAMYSFPHRFWTVTGTEATKTPIEDDDAMHFMATVWDPETGTVLPETGLSLELNRDGSLVSEEVIYPMLSQPMGFHYGGNFAASGDGTYTAEVSVGGTNIRRTGAFQDRFGDPATARIEFEYSKATRNDLEFRLLDRAGDLGALEPGDMEMVPNSLAPAEAALPGDVRGSAESGDARFVVTVLDSPPAGVDGDGQYLAVSPRTPYNRMVVPAMGLSGRLTRDGETIFEGRLERTLDPDLNYHYGAAVESVESGDSLTLQVGTPPQVARHEGYETAFLEMPAMDLTL
jgi:hypothetical protein